MNSAPSSIRSITVNGRFLSQSITGVQRYAFELLTSLDRLLRTGAIEQVPVTVLVPPDARALPDWSSIRIRQVGRFTGQLWEQLDLPIHARGSLLFTPCGGAPLTHRHHVITIHDAGPFKTPAAYTAGYRNYYKLLQKILSFTAAHVITVSEFSRQELITCLRIPPEKITFSWLSGQHILRCQTDSNILKKHNLQTGLYCLAVGSRNPNKNLRGIIAASTHLPPNSPELVIAGGTNHSIFKDSHLGCTGVRNLGFVNDNELRTLYENAGCFVFPSFYEGFGLPPLEALTLGCPVVVARAASLPEIFADTAIYCDPHAPQDIARQIAAAFGGKHPDRKSMVDYASQFTWERCATETWSILLRSL